VVGDALRSDYEASGEDLYSTVASLINALVYYFTVLLAHGGTAVYKMWKGTATARGFEL